jgi:hypothetical protein
LRQSDTRKKEQKEEERGKHIDLHVDDLKVGPTTRSISIDKKVPPQGAKTFAKELVFRVYMLACSFALKLVT